EAEEAAAIELDLVVGVGAAAELALESEGQDHQIDAGQLTVERVVLAQQGVDPLEQLLAGAVRAEELRLEQVLAPGVAADPPEVDEDLVGQRGHGVLRAAIDLDAEVAALAAGVEGLLLEDGHE